MKNRKYIIVNSKRFFIFMTFIFIICSILITLIFFLSKAQGIMYNQSYTDYYVKSGDSLWNISLEKMPIDYDVRRMVYDIKSLNNMETSYIYEGDIIKIPLYND